MNPVKITAKGTVATVTVEVDLNEWGGKYPDDDGVLNRASINIQKSREAVLPDAVIKLDAQIIDLQAQKANLDAIKPEVTKDPDVVNVADVAVVSEQIT